MSDVQDVLNTLAAQIAGFVYPDGTGSAPVIGAGAGVRVYPGWPMPAQLDADMPQGIAHVSVYPTAGERNTTRYAPSAHVMSTSVATLTLTLGAGTLTVGGAVPDPLTLHNMAVLIANKPYVYTVQANDTLASVATALATILAADYPGTTSAGPVVTLPAGIPATAARVGTSALVAREWERQQQRFQIAIWAPNYAARSAIGGAIKRALAKITFLTMPDGFGARILYQGNLLSDAAEKTRIYRRDMFYEIEYATTDQEDVATIVAFIINQQPLDPPGPAL